MEIIETAINFVLHLDEELPKIVATYGLWTYAILFTIIFLETGLVVTPFLPGDSLLFAAGSIAAHEVGGQTVLDVWVLWLVCASVLSFGLLILYTQAEPRMFPFF